MTMQHAEDSLPCLIGRLERSTLEIDRTFAGAGERLGHGLAVFEALGSRLAALSDDLLVGQMDVTRDVLLSVVRDLRAFEDALPGETRCLQEVACHGQAASQSLSRLTDHIRLIAAVTRSARIEAAQAAFGRQGASFFDEIGSLVARAGQTIETCATRHARLMGLLTAAMASQQSFASAYGPVLAILADRLEHTLGRIEDSRQKNVAATAEAARHSREIADAVGGAIIALQCGDSTRQRLEHAVAALRTAQDAADCHEQAVDPAVLEAVLRHLVAAQLRATAETMSQDVRAIDQVLQMLSTGIAASAAPGRARHGVDAGSDSFLAVLEADLAEATELIGRCDAAFAVVDQVTGGLKAFVEQFRHTAVSLSDIVRSIVLIGMNSGLHAARLGSEGRGLVVIAHELKTIADRIVADAAALSPTFELMQSATAGLVAGGGGRRLAGLDETMRQALADMKRSGTRMRETMEGLTADDRALQEMIEQAGRSFATACEAGESITATASLLADTTAIPHVSDPAGIETFLDREVWPSYTMAAERSLHRATLDVLGCGRAGRTGEGHGDPAADVAPGSLAVLAG